jgi:invasion protein IalB
MKFLIFLLVLIPFAHYTFAEGENFIQDFNDWQFFCEDSKKLDACEIRQFQISNETKEILSFISVTINPENKAQMLIGLPHMINLKVPAQINIDEKNNAEVVFTYCNVNACFIAEVINDEYLEILKSGNKLQLLSRFITNEEFNLTYSLSGFTAAYKKLSDNL